MAALIVITGLCAPVLAFALYVRWDMRNASLTPDEPYGFR